MSTHDVQVVARLEMSSGISHAQASFAATAGTYRIHVLGETAAGAEGGAFAVAVAPQAGGTPLVDKPGTIAADSSAPPAASVLQAQFDIAQSGDYTLGFEDYGF